MDELEFTPIYNMYLVFAAQAAIACVVKGIYHRHLIRALSRRAGELDSGAVIVSAVLMAAQDGICARAHGRIVCIRKIIRVYNKTVSVMAYLKAGMSEPAYLHILSPFQVS
jgi:hypothetical protein